MNLFGVGPAELIVILVVALVFVGPERLPRLAADLARTIREVRKYTGSLAAEFNEVIQDFERETTGERSQWKEIGDGLAGATQSVTEAIRGARADAESAGTTPSATSTPDAAPTNGNAPQSEPAWRDIPQPDADGVDTAPTEASTATGVTDGPAGNVAAIGSAEVSP